MKIYQAVLLAILLGVAVGVGTARLRARYASWDGDPAEVRVSGARPTGPVAPTPGAPKVVVDREQHDFGTMDASEEGSHEFVFTNAGTGPLRLSLGSNSCRCTVTVLDKNEIPSGKSTKVSVKWKAKEVIGAYRQTARISTNDPNRPQVDLTIVGEMTVAVRCDPPELVFSRISISQSATGQVRLLCNLPRPPLEVLDFKLSDQDTARCFRVTYEPMSQEQIRKEKGAKSGVLLRVDVKPGLPQGSFQQTIRLRTNLESDPAVVIPIKGDIASDITVAGSGWDADLGLLAVGTVSSREGAQRRLILIVRGPHCREVKFKPVRVVPEFLQVQLGEPSPIGTGNVVQTPLVVQIPKGSRPANHLGSEQGKLGQILLETTHPQVPRLRILVRFAVEGSG